MHELFLNQPGIIEGFKFVIKIPVQFRDVDGMGHANNVAYFAFLETARIEYFVQLMNLQNHSHSVNQLPFILGGQTINYRSPAFFRDVLLIGVKTNWVKKSSFGFEYVMQEETSRRKVAEGDGVHVMFNYQTARSMPVPEDWLEKLENFEGAKLQL